MTRPTCLDCGQVVDVRAGYHDCPGSKAVPDIHEIDWKTRAERAEKINAEYADARKWDLEALKSRLQRQEATVRERDEARANYEELQKRAAGAVNDADAARAELKTMTCMWNGLRDKLTEVRADRAQRDRRIAELEAALRAIEARAATDCCANGRGCCTCNCDDYARAALSAPAQRLPCNCESVTEAHHGDCASNDPQGAAPAQPALNQWEMQYQQACPDCGEMLITKGVMREHRCPAQPAKRCQECDSDLSEYNHKPSCTQTTAGLTFASAPAQPATAAKRRARKMVDSLGAAAMAELSAPPSPAATTLGDELQKHERYLNREISYDERHAPAAREATNKTNMGCVDHWHCDPTVAAHLCRSSHSGQCPSCGERAGAEAVISSNRDEDAAWTAHKALVQARATIKLAVECEDGIDGAQAEVTFRMIAAALAALDAARSKETK